MLTLITELIKKAKKEQKNVIIILENAVHVLLSRLFKEQKMSEDLFQCLLRMF
jgi:hypothetical protein